MSNRTLGFRIYLYLLSLIMLGGSHLQATPISTQSANDLFAAGNAFYRSQKFDEAREAYRQLLDAGYESAPVLYNLGTVNARLGENTTASAYLMRARKLRPRDADIRANLAYVMPAPGTNAAVADAVSMDNLWNRVSGYLTVEEWLTIVWVFLLIVCLSASALFFVHAGTLHIAARTSMWMALIFLLIVAAPAATQYYKSRVDRQVMVLSPAELLSGPAERFTRVANLSQGQIVSYLGDAPSGYMHIQLDNGLQGYTKEDGLMKL